MAETKKRSTSTPLNVLTVLLLALVAFSVQGILFLAWRHNNLYCSDASRNGDQASGLGPLAIEPRAFEPWPNDRPLPCFPSPEDWWSLNVQRSPSRVGFLMMKEMKVGGSTAAGVNLRIARGVAHRKAQNAQVRPCLMRNDHALASQMDYGRRDKERSFLWTLIRDPTKRAISQFFHFHVSREKVEPTDMNFQRHLETSPILHEYYLRTLSMKNVIALDNAQMEPVAMDLAQEILHDYDFIAITERFDESMVALMMLLPGVEMADILYLNAKGSGGFDDGAHNMTCFYIVPSYVSPGMKEYFDSPRWKNRVRGDTALYEAANRSLDLTIDRLGRAKFNVELSKFRMAQKLVNSQCLPVVPFPCSPGGQRTVSTGCIWQDSGCGTACLDSVAKTLDLFSEESKQYF